MGRWWAGTDFTRHLLLSKDVARHLVIRKSITSSIDTHRLPLADYFDSFNATFPLFNRKMFFTNFDQQYSNDPPKSSSWYGALNVVFSLSCLTARNSTCIDTISEDPWTRASFVELSWKFFQNASSVLLDLLFLNVDLIGVQTLIGMVLLSSHSLLSRSLTRFFQGLCYTSRTQPRSIVCPHRSCSARRAWDGPPSLARGLWHLPVRTRTTPPSLLDPLHT
jgi:hypothetical protein